MTSKNIGCLGALFQLFTPAPKKPRSSDISVFYLPEDEAIEEKLPYQVRDDFLSNAEASFYRVLRLAVNDRFLIFPKVSLAEIFFISGGGSYQTYQNKIDRKRTDFLLCDPQTLKPVLAIELDDSSHTRSDRMERDAFVEKVFADAQLTLVCIPTQMGYNTQGILELIEKSIQKTEPEKVKTALETHPNPICPKCNVPMVQRVARKGNNIGQKFWGCKNYPRCQEVFL